MLSPIVRKMREPSNSNNYGETDVYSIVIPPYCALTIADRSHTVNSFCLAGAKNSTIIYNTYTYQIRFSFSVLLPDRYYTFNCSDDVHVSLNKKKNFNIIRPSRVQCNYYVLLLLRELLNRTVYRKRIPPPQSAYINKN